ncbi:hypothetical protein PIB30_034696 [Stylosanthes scabra]|uniref:Uncharacterized protein n=1 Tax=Stylosanthes scabra TaxID=79078 RepID=A0ABU6TEU4_9FABA|nr:hypothetical protein [Stylosanthes scabra]
MLNVEPIQPPQHVTAELNAAAAIVDTPVILKVKKMYKVLKMLQLLPLLQWRMLLLRMRLQWSTTQPVIVLAPEKHVAEESVIVPRQAVTEELTLRDLPETKSARAKEHDIPTDKEVQKQMDLSVSIIAEMVALGDYLDFT